MTWLKLPRKWQPVVGNLVLCGIGLGILIMMGWCLTQMNRPLSQLPTQQQLDVLGSKNYFTFAQLVEAALRTMTRLFIGMLWSLAFSLVFGVMAARYKTARYFILPLVNLLESVPLLGFLTFTTAWFMGWFPNNVLGVEAVAIFGVFTAQAWNIMLVLYQSLRVTPKELLTVADQFGCNSWQRFWRLEFIYAVPGILWNMVISQSAAWFALVACEQATVAFPRTETLILPGIGSYIQIALDRSNFGAVAAALGALLVCVLFTNVCLFQPLIKGTVHYKYSTGTDNQLPPQSRVYDLVSHAKLPKWLHQWGHQVSTWWLLSLPQVWENLRLPQFMQWLHKWLKLWLTLWYFSLGCAMVGLIGFLATYLKWLNWQTLIWWTLLTTGRVLAAVVLSALIFIPLAVWVASNPRRLNRIQPWGQVIGSIPADVYVPVVALLIVATGTAHQWWVIPLIMTGTQWYFFFNVIAGYLAIPADIQEVTQVFHLKGWRWWTRFLFPSLFPYLITAIINAAGAAWNADIAAELITWGTKQFSVAGLGAYIAGNTDNKPAEATGVLIICGLVGICVIFIWQPLYRSAERRFHY